MSELKPCSKCGSTRVDLVPIRPDAPTREAQCWEPFCYDCDVAGYLGSEQARIDAWNRRPIEDELRATIAKMNQDSLHSLLAKLSMLDDLEELGNLRKKLSRAYYHLRRVIGDHNAPGDCYSTGPHEGNAMDHICPSCAALRELGEELKGHQ